MLAAKDSDVSFPAARPAGARDGVRLRAQDQGRRGEGGRGAAAPRGGGPDARRPPRPADRRADHRRADPGPRRGDHRPHEAPLRRRDQRSSRRRFPTSRRSASPPRRTAATRSRPAAAASSATATSRSRPPRRGAGFEFENAIKGGVIPTSFIPAVEKGIAEAMAERRARRLPDQGRPRAALRRPAPSRGLLGDGVQDRRLDGLQAGRREGRPGAARADHADDDLGARGRPSAT